MKKKKSQQEKDWYKKKTGKRLPSKVRDTIHGYIMSDGYITKRANLQVQQSLEQQGFVCWLFKKLKRQGLCHCEEPTLVENFNKKRQTTTKSLRFYTKGVMCGFASMWYEEVTLPNGETERRKKLPKSIKCFFSPRFVSVWFAGDGTSLPDCRAASFEVTSFTPDERELLKELFKSKYNISAELNKSGFSITGTQQWVLRIPAPEYDKFRAIITKTALIPKIFPHKLHP